METTGRTEAYCNQRKGVFIQQEVVSIDIVTTGNNPKYVNMVIMAEPPGGVEQSLTTATSTHGYVNVEHIAEHPGQTVQQPGQIELLCTYFVCFILCFIPSMCLCVLLRTIRLI